jgi:hypothetical protein
MPWLVIFRQGRESSLCSPPVEQQEVYDATQESAACSNMQSASQPDISVDGGNITITVDEDNVCVCVCVCVCCVCVQTYIALLTFHRM